MRQARIGSFRESEANEYPINTVDIKPQKRARMFLGEKMKITQDTETLKRKNDWDEREIESNLELSLWACLERTHMVLARLGARKTIAVTFTLVTPPCAYNKSEVRSQTKVCSQEKWI